MILSSLSAPLRPLPSIPPNMKRPIRFGDANGQIEKHPTQKHPGTVHPDQGVVRPEQLLQAFQNNKTYLTRMFATLYSPRHENGYVIHNQFFKPFNPQTMTANHLQKTFDDLKKKGTFKMLTHPDTGLIRTSDKDDDRHHMSRQWTTDSCMMFPLQRDTDPQGWKKNLMTNTAALNHPAARKAVEEAVKNPDWYREGHIKNGIPHIFWPGSVKLDRQGIPQPESILLDDETNGSKRLESQSLMLLRLLETVNAGYIPDQQGRTKPWGFQPQDLQGTRGNMVVNTLRDLSQYLFAVNTNPKTNTFDFHTPSASSWEEMPFKDGATWDAAVNVLAMENLKAFLYETNYPNITELQQQILANNEGLLGKENLDHFISSGRRYVDQRVTFPMRVGKDPVQTPERPYDSSLALLAGSDYRFVPDNKVEDAKIRLQLIQKAKTALMGEHGMRRYNEFQVANKQGQPVTLHDAYLNVDAHMPKEVLKPLVGQDTQVFNPIHESSDTMDAEYMLALQEFSRPQYAAQWQLGLSASLQGLAKAKTDVLNHIQQTGHATQDEKKLLTHINHELVDFTNRNLAAIPGPLPGTNRIYKADGDICKPYTALEAYQAVPDLNGVIKYIPGEHGLPWHASQLYDGLQKSIEAQELQESVQKQNILELS